MSEDVCERCWQESIVVEDIAQRVLDYGRRLRECEHTELERHGGWLATP